MGDYQDDEKRCNDFADVDAVRNEARQSVGGDELRNPVDAAHQLRDTMEQDAAAQAESQEQSAEVRVCSCHDGGSVEAGDAPRIIAVQAIPGSHGLSPN